jgi:hypothetical protein
MQKGDNLSKEHTSRQTKYDITFLNSQLRISCHFKYYFDFLKRECASGRSWDLKPLDGVLVEDLNGRVLPPKPAL